MKRFFTLTLSAALLVSSGCSLSKNSTKDKNLTPVMASRAGSDRNQIYATQYGTAAVLEMERDGIPASITLAQGILESGAGSSELAKNANNHFGIKCGSDWNGKTYKKKDDEKDESGNLKESCFRKYNKVEESFQDHAAFLRDPKKVYRYGFLFKLDRTDYKGWAEGLEAAGYSSSDTYAEKLIDIIERYNLDEYDRSAAGLPNPENPTAGSGTDAEIPLPNPVNRIGRINDTKVVLSREGETVADIAKAYRLNAMKVADYNDRGYTPAQKLKANTRVFIQSKKDKWSGRADEHYVKENETMFEISQLYGVKLGKLLERNRMTIGQEPAAGVQIKLKGKRPQSDRVRLREASTATAPGQQPDISTTPPVAETMTPDEEGYLDPIGEPQPQTGQPETNLPTGVKPPVVTGVPYPSDPTPNQPDSGVLTGTPQPKPPVVGDGYHYVVKGDTLYSIARKYNTTVARIKQLNNRQTDVVKIGETLRVN